MWVGISEWQRHPGSGYLLETILRNGRISGDLNSIHLIITLAVIHLGALLKHNSTPICYTAQLSLLASIHKVLFINTQDAIHTPSFSHTSPEQQAVLGHVACEGAMLRAILSAVLAQLVQGTRAIDRQDPEAPSTCAPQQQAPAGRSTEHSHVGGSAATALSSCTGNESNHFLAVLVLVLVRLQRYQLLAEEALPKERDRVSLAKFDLVGQVRVHDPELADVAAVALSLPLQPAVGSPESESYKGNTAAWDEYAVNHCHGRLLPGCSYLHCTNMSGSSEWLLPTLLCSGCRRTRYCSIDCQRAAWLTGGHADVCGKGKWAVRKM